MPQRSNGFDEGHRTAAALAPADPERASAPGLDLDFMDLLRRLWPLPRSITGDAVRQSLRILSEVAPFDMLEIPTGTPCFDWTIPREWNIRDAWIRDTRGRTLVDFRDSTLHVVGYSVPVHRTVSRDELLRHLHTVPGTPEAIPYRTSYYDESWGFCVAHDQLAAFTDAEYEVCIDATLEDGALTIGEGVVPGRTDREVLLSSYLCHPSMANNELSGPLVLAAVYRALRARSRPRSRPRFTYRFVLAPETIGSLAYLSRNLDHLREHLAAGYVISMVGIDHALIYKKSRREHALADRAAVNALATRSGGVDVREGSPLGGADQRQYCSLGIDLPVGFIGRALGGSYPEYHTSKDDLDLISPEALHDTVDAVLRIIDTLETNERYENLSPCGEPQLGRRGLYDGIGGPRASERNRAFKMLLGYGDGRHDLIDIADRMQRPALALVPEAAALERAGLLRPVDSRCTDGTDVTHDRP